MFCRFIENREFFLIVRSIIFLRIIKKILNVI